MTSGLILIIGLAVLAGFAVSLYFFVCAVGFLNSGKAAFRRYLELHPAPASRHSVLPPAPGEWREPGQ